MITMTEADARDAVADGRSLEILASANIAIPDDFKQVMSDYLDLTEK